MEQEQLTSPAAISLRGALMRSVFLNYGIDSPQQKLPEEMVWNAWALSIDAPLTLDDIEAFKELYPYVPTALPAFDDEMKAIIAALDKIVSLAPFDVSAQDATLPSPSGAADSPNN